MDHGWIMYSWSTCRTCLLECKHVYASFYLNMQNAEHSKVLKNKQDLVSIYMIFCFSGFQCWFSRGNISLLSTIRDLGKKKLMNFLNIFISPIM